MKTFPLPHPVNEIAPKVVLDEIGWWESKLSLEPSKALTYCRADILFRALYWTAPEIYQSQGPGQVIRAYPTSS